LPIKWHKNVSETVLIDRFSSKTALVKRIDEKWLVQKDIIYPAMSGIYHRCHKREFLLKFPRDRRRWIEWLYQAKKRYSGLSVLNYNEIQSPRKRKGIIDFDRLLGLLGFGNYDDLKDAHCKWVNSAMQTENRGKENKWTQSIAVGSKTFIEKMKETLGFKAKGRKINYADDTFELREVLTPYGKANSQESGNTFLWDQ
jgi:hypothetical protein